VTDCTHCLAELMVSCVSCDCISDVSQLLHVLDFCIRGFTIQLNSCIMSQGKNPIWEYFRKVDNEPSKAKCIECDKVLSLGSDKPRHQTVSGLKGHLSTCHKAIYTAYVKRVAEDDGEHKQKRK